MFLTMNEAVARRHQSVPKTHVPVRNDTDQQEEKHSQTTHNALPHR